MTDVAQLNQGHFYWVLVRSSAQCPEWQPARFTGAAGPSAGANWALIGFNGDVGHHFVQVVEIGPELTDRCRLASPTNFAAHNPYLEEKAPQGLSDGQQ